MNNWVRIGLLTLALPAGYVGARVLSEPESSYAWTDKQTNETERKYRDAKIPKNTGKMSHDELRREGLLSGMPMENTYEGYLVALNNMTTGLIIQATDDRWTKIPYVLFIRRGNSWERGIEYRGNLRVAESEHGPDIFVDTQLDRDFDVSVPVRYSLRDGSYVVSGTHRTDVVGDFIVDVIRRRIPDNRKVEILEDELPSLVGRKSAERAFLTALTVPGVFDTPENYAAHLMVEMGTPEDQLYSSLVAHAVEGSLPFVVRAAIAAAKPYIDQHIYEANVRKLAEHDGYVAEYIRKTGRVPSPERLLQIRQLGPADAIYESELPEQQAYWRSSRTEDLPGGAETRTQIFGSKEARDLFEAQQRQADAERRLREGLAQEGERVKKGLGEAAKQLRRLFPPDTSRN